jgi:sugar phosphate isomerase/epimerase
MLNTLTRRSFLASAAASALHAKSGPWLVGANTAIQGYSLDRAIALLVELQFPVIEIHPMGRPEPTPKVFPGFTFDQLDPAAKQKIKAALKPFRQITTHLPYTGLDWMSADSAKRESSVRAVDVALEGSAYFGAVMAVLHPQTVPGVEWKARKEQYVDTIGRWANRAQQLGIRIAMETGFAPSTASYVEFVQTIGHPNVGVTVDVGHQSRYAELTAKVGGAPKSSPESIRAYNDTTISIINRLGAKIFHLHVHDIDPETWQEHKPMQHGFVDYPRIFEALTKANYKGVLILEIGGDPDKMPGYLREARDKFRAWLT